MKKILFFLITILSISTTLISVNAEQISFYEGEYIDGVYVNKAKGGTIYYQKARFFRRSGDNQFSYCIEPFTMFNENSSYTPSLTADNLSNEQMQRIKEIIHFGYGYGSHTDTFWYAVTQFMVWQESDHSGDYYFTDSLNGNRITTFEAEMNQINSLINDYHTIPSIANANINLVEDEAITLTDTNNILSKYTSDKDFAVIKNNKLIINGLKEGKYEITLTRKEKINSQIPLFYNSYDSQNMVTVGDLDDINIKLNINVNKTSVEVTKIDNDTESIKPTGEASLIGAKYKIMDKDMNDIDELTIDDNNKAIISNLKYGKYFIKEIEPGIGYNLDKNIYEINITKDNPIIKLSLKNKVIETEVELHKQYGENDNYNNEVGISFDIYNNKDKLVDTITTNDNGLASIILPFGNYTFKQRNTTDGYTNVEDFKIEVINNKKIKKELYDYKIKVPNTYHDSSCNVMIILFLFLELLYVKKMVFC